MGERLRRLGVRLGERRSTALLRLTTELPAAVRALGIDIAVTVAVAVTVKGQLTAAGDWGIYADEISRRSTAQE
ncbi:hypothetical protein OG889_04270 [Streptomyces sp. NBC_00481]|uniref:hypothetical protein n=1 Tax=unclassified Streptomyces TaxID=2593676 RepID=UPI002DD91242|nr:MULTISPECIES: hypothetical protein [unclassified Streptomyces]WRY94004.1 hypothetical protein OG889_04270 [Streptomyces sp. NBC_00481]